MGCHIRWRQAQGEHRPGFSATAPPSTDPGACTSPATGPQCPKATPVVPLEASRCTRGDGAPWARRPECAREPGPGIDMRGPTSTPPATGRSDTVAASSPSPSTSSARPDARPGRAYRGARGRGRHCLPWPRRPWPRRTPRAPSDQRRRPCGPPHQDLYIARQWSCCSRRYRTLEAGGRERSGHGARGSGPSRGGRRSAVQLVKGEKIALVQLRGASQDGDVQLLLTGRGIWQPFHLDPVTQVGRTCGATLNMRSPQSVSARERSLLQPTPKGASRAVPLASGARSPSRRVGFGA